MGKRGLGGTGGMLGRLSKVEGSLGRFSLGVLGRGGSPGGVLVG